MTVVTSLPSMTLLEAFEAFPKVEKCIIIKADLVRQGVSFTKASREELAKKPYVAFKGFHLFSYDMDKEVMNSESIPGTGCLEDGTEQGTSWQVRTGAPDSPYTVDFIDGDFWVLYNGKKLSRTRWTVRNRCRDWKLEDGTPFAGVGDGGSGFITLNKHCDFFNIGKQCLFCDLTTHAAAQKKGGEAMILRKQYKDVCDVLEIIFGIGSISSRPRDRTVTQIQSRPHLFITGGSILGTYQGKTEVEWYADFLDAVHERLVQWPFTVFQIGALDDEGLKRIHATGVPNLEMNMEVWDKRLFEIICPGKSERVGYDEWRRRAIRAVDMWGPGRVTNNFVCGVEMCQPYGFTDVDQAVESTAEGYEWLMSNGIHARYGDMWCVEPTSKLAGNKMPPLEYFIKLAIAYHEIHEKYFPHHYPHPAPGSRAAHHGLEDMAYWHGTGLNTRYFEEKQGIKIKCPDYTKYLDT